MYIGGKRQKNCNCENMSIIARHSSSDILYNTSEDSDDSEYTTNILRRQWLEHHNKSIKVLDFILSNSDCKNQSNGMLPVAAVSSSSTPSSSSSSSSSQPQPQQCPNYNTPKRSNKRSADKMAPYQLLDSRISSSTSASLPSPPLSMSQQPITSWNSPSSSSNSLGVKRRRRTQISTEIMEESHEYIHNIHKTYCVDGDNNSDSSSSSAGTLTKYASLNDMLLINEALYTALMLQMGNSIMETACLHCRNLENMDLLEWSEAVLIQLCAINYNHLLYNTWSNVISLVESSEWGPKMSLNLQRIYGRTVRLSNILDMNHTMKIQKYKMPVQFVFRENRIPALNMKLLRTIPRCDRDDLEEMNLRQSLARLPIVVRKKKNV